MLYSIKSGLLVLLLTYLSSTDLMPCGRGNNSLQDPKNTEKRDDNMTEEQQAIKALIERRNKAMIERDIETMNSLMTDNLILAHITGSKQTKQGWPK